MKISRKIVAVILCLTLCGAVTACNEAKVERDVGVTVWSALNSEKIMRDVTYSDRAEGVFKVQAYRNETEGGQILMTPSQKINAYSIALSDLTSAAGNTLKKETMTVYHQKYVEVINPTKSFPTGWYPDALLPMDKAIEYGENTIEKDENQAVYISIDVPADQAAGVYTGSFTLTVDGKNIDVPAEVEVWDYTLPEENHLRTVFSIHRYWYESGIISGELDSTWDMYRKYYDYLLDYHISARYLPGAARDIDTFIVEATAAAKDPRVTNYILPYVASGNGLDMVHYKTLMTEMMRASLAENVDLFKKASTYFSMFDEANVDKHKQDLANSILKAVKDANAAYAEEFKTTFSDADPDKLAEYSQSMIKVVQLFVDEDEGKLDKGLGETYCPTVDHYNREAERNHYHEINPDERWWYTCLVPVNPFPTYHIDDNLYSSRIMSWMQYKYGVLGNLYWSTTYWLDTDNNPLQDYYGVAEHFPRANGDGYLLYPGKVYGIDGPVGSIRLHSIRDGMEDYEVLYNLGQLTEAAAEKAGVQANVNAVLGALYDRMFNGTVVNTDHETLLAMRQTLASIVTTTANTGVALLDAKTVDDSTTFTAYVPDGVTLTVKDVDPESVTSTDVTGGKRTTIVVPLSNARNALALSAEKEGKTYDVSINLGGKRTKVAAETFKDQSLFGAHVADVVNEAAGMRGQALNIKFNGTNKSFTYAPTDFNSFNLDTLKLLFTITVERDVELRVTVTGTKDPTANSAYTAKLAAGTHDIQIDLFNLNWGIIGDLKTMRISVVTDEDAANVTIGNIIYAE